MEKTIEYMRTAVLAECEAVCPSRLYAPIECGHLAFGYVEDDGVQMEAWFLYVGAATAPMSLYALAGEQVWLAAYYLLGLDKRDALEAAREKITTLEQQLEEAQNIKFEGMASPAWAMFGEFTKFMEEVMDSDTPRTTSWCVRLEDGEEVTLMNIWAATSHDSPITRATELRDLLDAEKEKSMRWESRAWKILQIVRRPSHRSRPKTAAVLRTLREVSEKNERLVEELTKIARLQHASYRSEVEAMKGIALNAIEAYKEGKKDE